MFTSKERLKKRTPVNGINREDYIEHLVEEFHTTTNIEAQEQVTANLANFSYDPINYDFLQKSGVIQLFTECIALPNETLVLHGIAGICNLSSDDRFRNCLLENNNIELVFKLLDKDKTDIIVNTLATLFLLLTVNEKSKICTPHVIEKISGLKSSSNKRVQSLAEAFLKKLDFVESAASKEL